MGGKVVATLSDMTVDDIQGIFRALGLETADQRDALLFDRTLAIPSQIEVTVKVSHAPVLLPLDADA